MADLNIYLIAKYVGQPKDPKQTHKSGYMTNPENIEYDEQLYISRGLRSKDYQNTVILNLTEQKVVKNGWKPGTSFKDLLLHYHEGYGDYINDCVNTIVGE